MTFRGHFLGDISWTFWVTFRGHFGVNSRGHYRIKKGNQNDDMKHTLYKYKYDVRTWLCSTYKRIPSVSKMLDNGRPASKETNVPDKISHRVAVSECCKEIMLK